MLNAIWIVILGMVMIFAVLGILFLVVIGMSKLVRGGEKTGARGQ